MCLTDQYSADCTDCEWSSRCYSEINVIKNVFWFGSEIKREKKINDIQRGKENLPFSGYLSMFCNTSSVCNVG